MGALVGGVQFGQVLGVQMCVCGGGGGGGGGGAIVIN